MHHRSAAFASLCAALVTGHGLCQETAAELREQAVTVARPADFLLPIHVCDGAGGQPELWASGPAYKASFHDGFEFFPLLGASYPHNLPLRWTTTAVTAGGEALALPETSRREHTDWRYTYVRGAVREVYDVGEGGVEQSFVIAERPHRAGDLVVEGLITTALRCAPLAPAHQALTFCDAAGTALVRYGEAIAIDAVGARTPVTTSWDGSTARLTVPAAWLATASFPLTIDPLTSAVQVDSLGSTVTDCDVGHADSTATRNIMVATERAFSATDHDMVACLHDGNLQSIARVMSQISATFDDRQPAVAHVKSTDRWLIGFVHGAWFRIHFHDGNSLVLNSGLSVDLPFPFFRPISIDLGGSTARGARALCVYQIDPLDGRPSQVGSVPIDTAARTIVFNEALNLGSEPVTSFDSEAPSVNQSGRSGWLVMWQHNTASNGSNWYMQGARFDASATLFATYGMFSDQTAHYTSVQVSGSGDWFTLSFLASADRSSTAATRLLAASKHLPMDGTSNPNRVNVVATAAPPLTVLTNHGIAHNSEADGTGVAVYTITRNSFPTVTASAYATRLTTAGAPVETLALHAVTGERAVAPAVTFVPASESFPMVYGTSSASSVVWGRRYSYPAGGGNSLYGVGCGPATIVAPAFPYIGNAHYKIDVSHTPPFPDVTTLLVGIAPLAAPLDRIGMTGCVLNVDQVLSIGYFAGPNGVTHFAFPLPETVLLQYDLYFQGVISSPGANPLGVVATRGLQARVR